MVREEDITMLDWLINLPLYGIAIYMFAIAIYFGTKRGGEDDDSRR